LLLDSGRSDYVFRPSIVISDSSVSRFVGIYTAFQYITLIYLVKIKTVVIPLFYATLEIFTAMKIHIVIFWVMTPCSDVR